MCVCVVCVCVCCGVLGVTYIPPMCISLQEWLSAAKGKGLSVMGTFSARNGQMFADMTLSNRALQPMNGFAIQFNKNR